MIVGGLIVFYLRAPRLIWRSDYIQVIGTIFFFPTLILLAIYLNMSRDAVVGILGAFLGSIFTRTTGPATPSPDLTTPSPDRTTDQGTRTLHSEQWWPTKTAPASYEVAATHRARGPRGRRWRGAGLSGGAAAGRGRGPHVSRCSSLGGLGEISAFPITPVMRHLRQPEREPRIMENRQLLPEFVSRHRAC